MLNTVSLYAFFGVTNSMPRNQAYCYGWISYVQEDSQTQEMLVHSRIFHSRERWTETSWHIANNLFQYSHTYGWTMLSWYRSAFYALNAIGSRFGYLHPLTFYHLYCSLCIPIVMYGCELWSLTKSEIVIMERVHRKILRTIQGLPTQCITSAVLSLFGSTCMYSLVQQRQLTFVHSLSTMANDALPKRSSLPESLLVPGRDQFLCGQSFSIH